MTAPPVSAIIPCFNVGALLLRTVNSLRGQTAPPAEILVVDDASTTPETLAALTEAERIPTVRVLRQPVNRGVAAARNLGLDQSIGDFAVFLDGDDMFTAPSLEAFLTALNDDPEASFAYPTVTCFGNRHDTFPAPEFNAYLLHHANICPIASMVNRAAIDSGVRFDPAIGIGHEDWDYWLRLVAAGFMGVAAPDAVLLYRRVGFTRNDLGNQIEGGFDARLRELRPELFDAHRLMALKREWAPGLSLVTSDPDRAAQQLVVQTSRDVEVVDVGNAADARGRVVVFEWAGSAAFLDDPFAIEDILSMGNFLAADQVLVSIAAAAVRPGSTSGIPMASDLKRGWVGQRDITAVAYPSARALTLVRNNADVQGATESLLRETGVQFAHRVLWRAPQATNGWPSATDTSDPIDDPPPARRHAAGWTRDVISGLRPGAPWRTATSGGLFGTQGPSAFRELVWVEDPFGGRSLYAVDEEILVGSRTFATGPGLLRASVAGTAALTRVEDATTHQRSLTVAAVLPNQVLQSVLGFAEVQATPGARPLLFDEPATAAASTEVPWVNTTIRDDGQAWPRSSDILYRARVVWRAVNPDTGEYQYAFDPRQLTASELLLEGRVAVVYLEADLEDALRPVWPLWNTAGGIIGLTCRHPREGDAAASSPLGFLHSLPAPGRNAIIVSRTPSGNSVLCSSEGPAYAPDEDDDGRVLGFSVAC